jgi:hypothetical protein
MSAGFAGKPSTKRRRGQPLALTVFVWGLLAVAPAAAHAGAQMAADATFPPSVTVGQKGLSATVVLENTSTGPEAQQVAFVCNADQCNQSEGITITPSCGAINNVPACTSPEPGVFSVAPVATLAPGSSCGMEPSDRFDVALVDTASGKLRITPQRAGARVVLGPKGTPSAICQIQLTFDVVKQPTVDSSPGQPGIQTLQLVSADMMVSAVQGFGRGSSTGTTVEPLPPPPPPPPAPVIPDVSKRPTAPAPGTTGGSASVSPNRPLISPFPVIRLRGRADGAGVLITLLRVQAPKGTRVTIYCKGRSCKWRKIWRYAAATGVVRVRAFEHRLRAGTTLSIYVTRAGFTGKYTRFRINKRKPPSRRDLCARSAGAASVTCPVN